MPNVSRMVKEYESKHLGRAPAPKSDNLGKDPLSDSLTPAPKVQPAPPTPLQTAPVQPVQGLTSVGKMQNSVQPAPLEQGATKFDGPILGPDQKKVQAIRIEMMGGLSAPFGAGELTTLGGDIQSAVASRAQDPQVMGHMGSAFTQAGALMTLAGDLLHLDIREMLGESVAQERAVLCRKLEACFMMLDALPLEEVRAMIFVPKKRASNLARLYLDLHIASLPIYPQ